MKHHANQAASVISSTQAAGFGRRLGAMFYDLLPLIAVLLLAATPFVLITGAHTSKNFFIRFVYQLYLLGVIFLYYGGFWKRGGQTLGLLTWRLKVVTDDGSPFTWTHAAKRFAAAMLSLACGGLGFVWILFDRDKLAWHDRLSHTRIVRIVPAPPTETTSPS